MATTSQKKPVKLLGVGKWRPSWKRLFIGASVALNVAFIVMFLTMAFTNVLDGAFMATGLDRYCSYQNDDKFRDGSKRVIALRDFVCDRNEAHPYFQAGLNKYLDSKYIPHN